MRKDKVTPAFYRFVHYWLKVNYGKATKCESDTCEEKSKRYEWSLIHPNKYEAKRENFRQLCKSCHAKYDITEESKKKISEKVKEYKKTHPSYNKGVYTLKKRVCAVCKKRFRPSNWRIKHCSVKCKGRVHSEKMKKMIRSNSISYKGELSTTASLRLGGEKHLIIQRLRRGWSKKKAFTTPYQTKQKT